MNVFLLISVCIGTLTVAICLGALAAALGIKFGEFIAERRVKQ